jgi:hypothetical protein
LVAGDGQKYPAGQSDGEVRAVTVVGRQIFWSALQIDPETSSGHASTKLHPDWPSHAVLLEMFMQTPESCSEGQYFPVGQIVLVFVSAQ